MQSTSWRTATKNRKLKLQGEPSWFASHCGQPEEIRKSWKYFPRSCAGPSYLSPGIVPWTTTKFWDSFENGRHLQNTCVIRIPREQQLSRTRCRDSKTNNSTTDMQWESQRGKSKNVADGLKMEPAGETIRREEQENTLTQLSHPSVWIFTIGTSHTTKSIVNKARIF